MSFLFCVVLVGYVLLHCPGANFRKITVRHSNPRDDRQPLMWTEEDDQAASSQLWRHVFKVKWCDLRALTWRRRSGKIRPRFNTSPFPVHEVSCLRHPTELILMLSHFSCEKQIESSDWQLQVFVQVVKDHSTEFSHGASVWQSLNEKVIYWKAGKAVKVLICL